ncbi:AAA family ATPase [Gluconobacter kondonii]|uniref:AAA family ATPase n=1 Tax=Gluconobacter kondonii TaxID=941463 RepID=UPI0031FEEB8D
MLIEDSFNIKRVSKGGYMILTVGNTKGGVGKTTLAVQIAIFRALQGRDVWLIDGDRQGTAASAISIRTEANQNPGIACAQYADGPTLRGQIQQQKNKWDDIIIDAGGRDSTALRASLILSDILLVPFAPRSYDVWALDDMAKLIDEARSVRDGLNCFAVMNQADPGLHSSDNSEAASAVSEVKQFQYLDMPIRRRKAFSNASGAGLAVSEMPVKDAKACKELEKLSEYLFNIKLIS